MEIYKETNTEASREFEKLLDNQISKTKIQLTKPLNNLALKENHQKKKSE